MTEEVHELVAVRLADDEQRPVADLLALPQPELDALVRGEPPPALVIIAQPGEVGAVVVGDGTLTEPGRYVVACFIPIGAPTAAEVAAAQSNGEAPPTTGPAHHTAGMLAEVTVVAA